MTSPSERLEVLYEDNHLLVVNKPAMLPTMGVSADRPSLLAYAKDYIRRKYKKPGNVYLGIVSRLDAPVSGAVVIARTSKAAGRLSELFKKREVQKTYWAVVEEIPEQSAATLENYIRKDERHRRVHVTNNQSDGAQLARLSYRVLGSRHGVAWLEVDLQTGRKHQIRVQLSKLGHPILGDRKYGSTQTFPLGIALHASSIELVHPVRKELLTIKASLPKSWRQQHSTSHLLQWMAE